MPDFTAKYTTPATTTEFVDGDLGVPSRLNAVAGHPHRHVKLLLGSTAITAKATVGGVEGEVDANLGGRLFTWHWTQWPGYPALSMSLPVITTPGGQSSVANTDLAPLWSLDPGGLWILCCRRANGGAVLLPLTAEGSGA